MAEGELMHLELTLEMLAEELNRAGLVCRVERGAGERRFRGARLYTGQRDPAEDEIYVLRAQDAARFPGDRCACVSPVPAAGQGGCVLCMNRAAEDVLDALLEIFARCREMEERVDGLAYRSADLGQLCELGAGLLDNPICIHDDWFVMIARSAELPEVMPPDYIMSSSKEYIPRIIVEDFKTDGGYLETYAYRTAQLWQSAPEDPKCLYANLWEGSVYRGRLLVVQHHRDFRRLDYALADLLAQRALFILNRQRPGPDRSYRSMDDIVFDLLAGRQTEPQEAQQFLSLLGWSREDALACLRLESREAGNSAVLEHALHSDLFQAFPQAYILFAGQTQCVVLNAERESVMPANLRDRLAPLRRDYSLCVGISSPVAGIRELPIASVQAQAALDKALRQPEDAWALSFSDCALEYLAGQAQGLMRPIHLVAPELPRLIAHDRAHGTQYYATLRAYLLQERDIPRTAAALIIHRTTLLYRLKKLQEVTPMDLDDPRRRLHLLLSIWILENEQK